MIFVDTHCHLDDERLKTDVDGIVNDFNSAGVKIAINVGCDALSSETVKNQAEKFDGVFFAAGIHPMEVNGVKDGDLSLIKNLALHPKCVAIGEIGLDYYWDKTFKDKQKEYFARQIALAYSLKLPINVHVRDAYGDALEILKENKAKLGYGGVMHCYSGSIETAKELLNLGFYFSFGGTLTFKNARTVVEVVKFLPKDRILTETDSPYLAPEPVRGTVNTPKNIPFIVKKLAELRGESLDETAEYVYNNTLNLFKKIKQ